jgi:2-alkyl-3-oxoalkanoate reductase
MQAGAIFLPGDLSNTDFVRQLPAAEVVIHAAALSSPWGKYDDFYAANVLATQNLLDYALNNHVRRLVYISTPSVYTTSRPRLNIRESEPLPQKQAHPYAQTKWKAEKLVNQAARQGLETIILRPRAIIGRGDLTIMPRLLRANQTGRLQIIGNGNTLADLTSVVNVVEAVKLSLQAPASALGETYNLSNGEPVNLWTTIEQILNRLGMKLNRKKMPFRVALGLASVLEMLARLHPAAPEPSLTRQGVMALACSATLDISKARQLLGYQPVQSTSEAMEEFAVWWENRHEKEAV